MERLFAHIRSSNLKCRRNSAIGKMWLPIWKLTSHSKVPMVLALQDLFGVCCDLEYRKRTKAFVLCAEFMNGRGPQTHVPTEWFPCFFILNCETVESKLLSSCKTSIPYFSLKQCLVLCSSTRLFLWLCFSANLILFCGTVHPILQWICRNAPWLKWDV